LKAKFALVVYNGYLKKKVFLRSKIILIIHFNNTNTIQQYKTDGLKYLNFCD